MDIYLKHIFKEAKGCTVYKTVSLSTCWKLSVSPLYRCPHFKALCRSKNMWTLRGYSIISEMHNLYGLSSQQPPLPAVDMKHEVWCS